MASAPTTAPPRGDVDPATGRLLPLSDEQRQARTEALNRALDALADLTDATDTDATDTDATWREVMRGLDEGRPHRPLFEGAY